MNVGESVRHAIDDWEAGKLEAAMLHACNAGDGTAKKVYSREGVGTRFTRLLRENYGILGPMGAPGLDICATHFPVKVRRAPALGGKPDIADVIYGIHRCTHGHGDELPDGFDLIPVAARPSRRHPLVISDGAVQLSDRIIFGLLAVAVLSSANVDQRVPDGYMLLPQVPGALAPQPAALPLIATLEITSEGWVARPEEALARAVPLAA
jgi:hypothetical protein